MDDGWMKERNELSLLDVCMYVAGRVLILFPESESNGRDGASKLFISIPGTNKRRYPMEFNGILFQNKARVSPCPNPSRAAGSR